MRQIIQSFRTGETILENVPAPRAGAGQVLVRTSNSLVSLGTERMLVEFGRSSLLAKARAQPDKVRQVLDKVRAEGLMPTIEAVTAKLDQPIPLGYCNVGVVVEVGPGVSGLAVGDRVASNGPHAEWVAVPQHLCARVPEGVEDEEAAFTVIASIGLQGLRLAAPTLGETVVVIGLGLIGLLTVQLAAAAGARVIGIDRDEAKAILARSLGAEALATADGTDPVATVLSLTGGVGADAVLICASAKGSEIVSEAARMSRKRGRVVLVGVTGLELNRAEWYEKELTFQVSCSYGPGRYDEAYEQRGQDYPLPFVRWTEQRNFEAVLAQMAAGRLRCLPLITERVPLADYRQIYGDMQRGAIASLLMYPTEAEAAPRQSRVAVAGPSAPASAAEPVIGIVGAGNFVKMTMLPALQAAQAQIRVIASAQGVSGTYLAKKHGIGFSSTDWRKDVLGDEAVRLVLLATRHGAHAAQVAQALAAGKHVFVEKPLALTQTQLDQVEHAYAASRDGQGHGPQLMVGYNRRFAPLVQKMKTLLGPVPGPLSLVLTMNAGAIPPGHWVHDLESGGGRLLGEACHLIDLALYLAASPITAVCANAIGLAPDAATDSAQILLRHASGAQSVVNYLAQGHKAYSKERVEAYHQGRTLILDNYRRLDGYGYKSFSKATSQLDKGHRAQFDTLLQALRQGKPAPIPYPELINSTLATLAVAESISNKAWVEVFNY